MPFDVSGSIVLYRNEPAAVVKAIGSFLSTDLSIKLYLVDNSPTDTLRTLSEDPRVEYIYNGANFGFGKAHNIALAKALLHSTYHVILNPDVYFDAEGLLSIFKWMEKHPRSGALMPMILYPDGQIQYAGKLLPSPIDLIARRVFLRMKYFRERNDIYELRSTRYRGTLNVPNHLGCFMFLRTEVLKQSGMFDENIFMYMEDVDLTRRIHQYAETVFYPGVTVYHHYEKGSQKKLRLLLYHIRSAIYYFNKWGWFTDAQRTAFNRKAVAEASAAMQET